VACQGTATSRRSGGELELVFADGSALRWQAMPGAPTVALPAVSDGQAVWADFSASTSVVCPVCGSYQTTLLQIRTAMDGPLLWIGREGVALGDVSADLVQELFGVAVHEQLSCERSLSAGCFHDTRQVFDHILATTPEQVIPAASLRHIVSPKGEYDVLWAHSSDLGTYQQPTACADGPGVASDTGFAASRTAPPSGD
jgi:hypothetical protein